MQTVNDQQQKGGVELIQQIANLHDQLVESHDFAQALQGIRRLQGQTPGAFSSGALEELENDYRLMADFMLKGFKDPQRNALYGRLVRSMSSLLRNMEVEVERKYDPFFSPLVRLTASTKLDPTGIEQKLVKHVQDVAMLSLDEEQVASNAPRSSMRRISTSCATCLTPSWFPANGTPTWRTTWRACSLRPPSTPWTR